MEPDVINTRVNKMLQYTMQFVASSTSLALANDYLMDLLLSNQLALIDL